MARSLGNMVIHLGLDSRGMVTGAKQAESAISELRTKISVAATAMASGVAAFVGWGVKIAADAQTAKVAFEVMLGSADKANKLFNEIKDFAASTPFQFPEIQDSARKLLAFGSSAEGVIGELRMLGDVAAGVGAPLGEIAELYGKMKVQQTLYAEDLNQLMGRGIPVLQLFAAQLGVADSEVKKLASEGKISFANLEQAFKTLTSSGGIFSGMMERMSQTVNGQLSTLKDNVAELASTFGQVLLPAVNRFLESAIDFVNMLKGMNTETAEQIVRIGAMAAAFGAAMVIIPKVIATIGTLIKAFKALTTAQAITQALSGPKGWAVLAGSLAAAAAAGYAVNQMFKEQEQVIAKSAARATEMSTAATEANQAFDSISKSAEKTAEATTQTNDMMHEAVVAAKQLGNVRMNVGAAERFTSQGFSASQSTRLADLLKQGQDAQLSEAKKHTELLAEGNRLAKEKSGVTLKKVTL